MYNSIYPVNINYRKYNQPANNLAKNSSAQNSNTNVDKDAHNSYPQNTFPNGSKAVIDYNSGQINISQVLADFRNTIVAINAPDDVRDEVSIYLNLVDRESKKEAPSRDIILANLKNASRISDDFIARSLNKKSNVVEGWIDALFLQKINLKADPDEINPAFQLEFPKEAQEKIDAYNESSKVKNETEEDIDLEQIKNDSLVNIFEQDNDLEIKKQSSQVTIQDLEVASEIEISEQNAEINSKPLSFQAVNELDKEAKTLFSKAKKMPKTASGYTEAINLLNEALGLMDGNVETNNNIKAAIHFERGRIFDEYDYVDYALRDYHEATKANEPNLKAQAYYKSGKIYDEFKEYSPALDNYLSSVAYSGEADNYVAQTTVLSKIADLYAKQYDIEQVDNYSSLALDSAQNSTSKDIIAQTYSNNAQNYQYLGENEKALDGYKNALAIMSSSEKKLLETAHNYEQASIVMRKLGNHLKADKLQAKALLYYQRAQHSENQLEEVS